MKTLNKLLTICYLLFLITYLLNDSTSASFYATNTHYETLTIKVYEDESDKKVEDNSIELENEIYEEEMKKEPISATEMDAMEKEPNSESAIDTTESNSEAAIDSTNENIKLENIMDESKALKGKYKE